MFGRHLTECGCGMKAGIEGGGSGCLAVKPWTNEAAFKQSLSEQRKYKLEHQAGWDGMMIQLGHGSGKMTSRAALTSDSTKRKKGSQPKTRPHGRRQGEFVAATRQ
jgi:hypothetical protein